jgi:hypothetical protein
MRWTDLPPDRDPADADASVLRRGEWEDLRQRLERLPPGHPSRPGDEADPDERRAASSTADPDGHRAALSTADPDRTEDDRADEGGSPGRRGVMDKEPGRREPYRPWFSEGESPQPWFAAGPEDGP